MSRVVQSADEWAGIVCSSLRCQECLVGREDKGHIGLDAFLVEFPHCFEPFRCHGALYNDIGSEAGEIMALSDHSLRILADHLEVHWTRDQFQYVMNQLGEFSVLFRDECRVGGYPIENTHVDEGLDRRNVGRV